MGVGLPHLRPMNVDDNGQIVLDKVKYVETVEDVTKYFVKSGDVIFNNTNSEELVGKTAYWDRDGGFVLSNHMTIIRVLNPEALDSFYLARLLHKLWFDGFYLRICRRHVNQASISLERLKQIVIPVPPIVEQRRIARVLSTIQRAIEAQEKVIAAAHELKRSLMKHLFTYGPVPITETSRVPLKETEIGPMPEHWQAVELGEACQVDWGNTSLTKAIYKPIGFPAFSATGQDGFLDFHEHEGEAIVLSAIGARCGKCFLATGKWTAIKNTIVMKPVGAMDIVFLYRFLDDAKRWPKSGTGQPFIALGNARRIKIPYPPVSEQRQIGDTLRAAGARIEAEEKRKAALQALFKTMLHHLMTAKIRVRDL